MDQFNNNGGLNLNKDNNQQNSFQQGAFDQNAQQNAQPQQGAFAQNAQQSVSQQGAFNQSAFEQNMQQTNTQAQPGAFNQSAYEQNLQQPMQNNNFGSSNFVGGMQPQKSTKAGISLGLGIASLVLGCCCTWLGIALGVAAIILGVLSKKDNEPKSGMAMAGIIIGAVSIFGTIIWMIISAVTGIGEEVMNSFME